MMRIIPRSLALVISTLVLGCALRGQQAYHKVDIIPNQAGSTIGDVCFVETTGWGSGAVQKVCLDAPASIASTFTLTLPNALPGSPSCIEFDTSGNGTYVACAGGAGHPVVDTTSLVEGSVDATKEIRFEVDGLTTGQIRVLTPQDANYILAATNLDNDFSILQRFQQDVRIGGELKVGDTGSSAEAPYEAEIVGDLLLDNQTTGDVILEVRGGSSIGDDATIELDAGNGIDYRLRKESATGLYIETLADNEIAAFEEDSTTMNELRLFAGNDTSDDVRIRFLNNGESNGYNLTYDQDPSDNMLLETHNGTDILLIDVSLASFQVPVDADGFQDNGTAGIDRTCAGSETLTGIQVSGGIIVAGTCTTN